MKFEKVDLYFSPLYSGVGTDRPKLAQRHSFTRGVLRPRDGVLRQGRDRLQEWTPLLCVICIR